MAKWKSPFLSDIRNKLGENVVFSQWKGRPYMRTYVVPANPNTSKQQANREDVKNLVQRWQSIATTEDIKSAWDEFALSYQISGFNLFTKAGRKDDCSAVAGTGSGEVDVTYDNVFEPGETAMFVYDEDVDSWTEEVSKGNLDSGTGKTEDLTGLTTGNTVHVYLAYPTVLVSGDSTPKEYQAVCAFTVDESAGTSTKNSVSVPS